MLTEIKSHIQAITSVVEYSKQRLVSAQKRKNAVHKLL